MSTDQLLTTLTGISQTLGKVAGQVDGLVETTRSAASSMQSLAERVDRLEESESKREGALEQQERERRAELQTIQRQQRLIAGIGLLMAAASAANVVIQT